MANPQIENGYTRIANEIMDVLCSFRIPGEVRLVLDCILRKTYGWNKKEDWISNSQLVEITRLRKGNVSRSLSKLITHRLVIKVDNKLMFNKDYKKWIKFGVIKTDNIKKLSKLIPKLSKVRDTKDIIQKTKKYNTAALKKEKGGELEKIVEEIDKKENIRYPYQAYGLEIWEKLKAPSNKKSEFIRIVRDYPEGVVQTAFSFAVDYPVVEIKWKMFFKKLNELTKK